MAQEFGISKNGGDILVDLDGQFTAKLSQILRQAVAACQGCQDAGMQQRVGLRFARAHQHLADGVADDALGVGFACC